MHSLKISLHQILIHYRGNNLEVEKLLKYSLNQVIWICVISNWRNIIHFLIWCPGKDTHHLCDSPAENVSPESNHEKHQTNTSWETCCEIHGLYSWRPWKAKIYYRRLKAAKEIQQQHVMCDPGPGQFFFLNKGH